MIASFSRRGWRPVWRLQGMTPRSTDLSSVVASLALATLAQAALIPLSASYECDWGSATGVGVLDTDGGSNWVDITLATEPSFDPALMGFALVHDVLGNGMRRAQPGDWNLWDFHGGNYSAYSADAAFGYSEIRILAGTMVQQFWFGSPLAVSPVDLTYHETIRRGPPDPDRSYLSDWEGRINGDYGTGTHGFYIGVAPTYVTFSGQMELSRFSVTQPSSTQIHIEWEGWMTPEPASVTLFGFGAGLLAIARCQRGVWSLEIASPRKALSARRGRI